MEFLGSISLSSPPPHRDHLQTSVSNFKQFATISQIRLWQMITRGTFPKMKEEGEEEGGAWRRRLWQGIISQQGQQREERSKLWQWVYLEGSESNLFSIPSISATGAVLMNISKSATIDWIHRMAIALQINNGTQLMKCFLCQDRFRRGEGGGHGMELSRIVLWLKGHFSSWGGPLFSHFQGFLEWYFYIICPKFRSSREVFVVDLEKTTIIKINPRNNKGQKRSRWWWFWRIEYLNQALKVIFIGFSSISLLLYYYNYFLLGHKASSFWGCV